MSEHTPVSIPSIIFNKPDPDNPGTWKSIFFTTIDLDENGDPQRFQPVHPGEDEVLIEPPEGSLLWNYISAGLTPSPSSKFAPKLFYRGENVDYELNYFDSEQLPTPLQIDGSIESRLIDEPILGGFHPKIIKNDANSHYFLIRVDLEYLNPDFPNPFLNLTQIDHSNGNIISTERIDLPTSIFDVIDIQKLNVADYALFDDSISVLVTGGNHPTVVSSGLNENPSTQYMPLPEWAKGSLWSREPNELDFTSIDGQNFWFSLFKQGSSSIEIGKFDLSTSESSETSLISIPTEGEGTLINWRDGIASIQFDKSGHILVNWLELVEGPSNTYNSYVARFDPNDHESPIVKTLITDRYVSGIKVVPFNSESFIVLGEDSIQLYSSKSLTAQGSESVGNFRNMQSVVINDDILSIINAKANYSGGPIEGWYLQRFLIRDQSIVQIDDIKLATELNSDIDIAQSASGEISIKSGGQLVLFNAPEVDLTLASEVESEEPDNDSSAEGDQSNPHPINDELSGDDETEMTTTPLTISINEDEYWFGPNYFWTNEDYASYFIKAQPNPFYAATIEGSTPLQALRLSVKRDSSVNVNEAVPLDWRLGWHERDPETGELIYTAKTVPLNGSFGPTDFSLHINDKTWDLVATSDGNGSNFDLVIKPKDPAVEIPTDVMQEILRSIGVEYRNQENTSPQKGHDVSYQVQVFAIEVGGAQEEAIYKGDAQGLSITATDIPPQLESATYTGRIVELFFSRKDLPGWDIPEALEDWKHWDFGHPDKKYFEVLVDGEPQELKAVFMDRHVVLILKDEIPENADSVQVSYTPPEGDQIFGVIQDWVMNDVPGKTLTAERAVIPSKEVLEGAVLGYQSAPELGDPLFGPGRYVDWQGGLNENSLVRIVNVNTDKDTYTVQIYSESLYDNPVYNPAAHSSDPAREFKSYEFTNEIIELELLQQAGTQYKVGDELNILDLVSVSSNQKAIFFKITVIAANSESWDGGVQPTDSKIFNIVQFAAPEGIPLWRVFSSSSWLENFESITGSSFDDVLTGSLTPTTFFATEGDDTYRGVASNDTVDYTNIATDAITFNFETFATTVKKTDNKGTDTLYGVNRIKLDSENVIDLPLLTALKVTATGEEISFQNDSYEYTRDDSTVPMPIIDSGSHSNPKVALDAPSVNTAYAAAINVGSTNQSNPATLKLSGGTYHIGLPSKIDPGTLLQANSPFAGLLVGFQGESGGVEITDGATVNISGGVMLPILNDMGWNPPLDESWSVAGVGAFGNGHGTLLLDEGAELHLNSKEFSFFAVGSFDGTGTTTITGANSNLSVSGQEAQISVGQDGRGFMEVLDGATVNLRSEFFEENDQLWHVARVKVGEGTSGSELIVSDSSFTIEGHRAVMEVGHRGLGDGRLQVLNGAALVIKANYDTNRPGEETAAELFIGGDTWWNPNDTGWGEVWVSGANSKVEVLSSTNSASYLDLFRGEIRIEDGAEVEVSSGSDPQLANVWVAPDTENFAVVTIDGSESGLSTGIFESGSGTSFIQLNNDGRLEALENIDFGEGSIVLGAGGVLEAPTVAFDGATLRIGDGYNTRDNQITQGAGVLTINGDVDFINAAIYLDIDADGAIEDTLTVSGDISFYGLTKIHLNVTGYDVEDGNRVILDTNAPLNFLALLDTSKNIVLDPNDAAFQVYVNNARVFEGAANGGQSGEWSIDSGLNIQVGALPQVMRLDSHKYGSEEITLAPPTDDTGFWISAQSPSRLEISAIQVEQGEYSYIYLVDLHTGETLRTFALDSDEYLVPSKGVEPVFYLAKLEFGANDNSPIGIEFQAYSINPSDFDFGADGRPSTTGAPFSLEVRRDLGDALLGDGFNIQQFVAPNAYGSHPGYVYLHRFDDGSYEDGSRELYTFNSNGQLELVGLPEMANSPLDESWSQLFYQGGNLWFQIGQFESDQQVAYKLVSHQWQPVNLNEFWDAEHLAFQKHSTIRDGEFILDLLVELDLPAQARPTTLGESSKGIPLPQGGVLVIADIEGIDNKQGIPIGYDVALLFQDGEVKAKRVFNPDNLKDIFFGVATVTEDPFVYFVNPNAVSGNSLETLQQSSTGSTLYRINKWDIEKIFSNTPLNELKAVTEVLSVAPRHLHSQYRSTEFALFEQIIPVYNSDHEFSEIRRPADITGFFVETRLFDFSGMAPGRPEPVVDRSFITQFDLDGNIIRSTEISAKSESMHVVEGLGLFIQTDWDVTRPEAFYFVDFSTGDVFEISEQDFWDLTPPDTQTATALPFYEPQGRFDASDALSALGLDPSDWRVKDILIDELPDGGQLVRLEVGFTEESGRRPERGIDDYEAWLVVDSENQVLQQISFNTEDGLKQRSIDTGGLSDGFVYFQIVNATINWGTSESELIEREVASIIQPRNALSVYRVELGAIPQFITSAFEQENETLIGIQGAELVSAFNQAQLTGRWLPRDQFVILDGYWDGSQFESTDNGRLLLASLHSDQGKQTFITRMEGNGRISSRERLEGEIQNVIADQAQGVIILHLKAKDGSEYINSYHAIEVATGNTATITADIYETIHDLGFIPNGMNFSFSASQHAGTSDVGGNVFIGNGNFSTVAYSGSLQEYGFDRASADSNLFIVESASNPAVFDTLIDIDRVDFADGALHLYSPDVGNRLIRGSNELDGLLVLTEFEPSDIESSLIRINESQLRINIDNGTNRPSVLTLDNNVNALGFFDPSGEGFVGAIIPWVTGMNERARDDYYHFGLDSFQVHQQFSDLPLFALEPGRFSDFVDLSDPRWQEFDNQTDRFGNLTDIFDAGAGDDLIFGAGSEGSSAIVRGGAGNDWIYVGEVPENREVQIFGDAGNDTITVSLDDLSAGSRVWIDGGVGNDHYRVAFGENWRDATAEIIIDGRIGLNQLTVELPDGDGPGLWWDSEGLRIGPNDPQKSPTLTAGFNTIRQINITHDPIYFSMPVIQGALVNPTAAQLNSGQLFGGNNADVLLPIAGVQLNYDGRGGDDLIIMNDVAGGIVSGGPGNDIIFVNAPNATAPLHTLSYTWTAPRMEAEIYLDFGFGFVTDFRGNLVGSDRFDGEYFHSVIGGRGNETIYGNRFANVLDGGAGDDILFSGRNYAGEESNRLIGGLGNDILVEQIRWNGTAAEFKGSILEGGAGNDIYVIPSRGAPATVGPDDYLTPTRIIETLPNGRDAGGQDTIRFMSDGHAIDTFSFTQTGTLVRVELGDSHDFENLQRGDTLIVGFENGRTQSNAFTVSRVLREDGQVSGFEFQAPNSFNQTGNVHVSSMRLLEGFSGGTGVWTDDDYFALFSVWHSSEEALSSVSNGTRLLEYYDGAKVQTPLSMMALIDRNAMEFVELGVTNALDSGLRIPISFNSGRFDSLELILPGDNGPAFLFGGSGSDIIVDSPHNDVLIGGSGNDLLISYFGNDIMLGGSGNNTLVFRSDGQIIIGGSGNNHYVVAGVGDEAARLVDFDPNKDSITFDPVFLERWSEYLDAENPLTYNKTGDIASFYLRKNDESETHFIDFIFTGEDQVSALSSQLEEQISYQEWLV